MSDAPQIFDRNLLRRRRERAAAGTPADFLLQEVARDLADRLSLIKRDFAVALDLGSHTGEVARSVERLANVGGVIRADSSPLLLRGATGMMVACDEEFLPFAPDSLDLVVSGLALHWVNDLPGTLVQISRVLKPDGLLLASLLGGATLSELRQALVTAEAELTGGAAPRVAPFADVRDMGALLQRAGLALPVADSDRLTVTYANMFDLMGDLRAMGATNVLVQRSRKPLRRNVLLRAAQIYADRFGEPTGRIRATFEIITLTGWRPHDSQQQPLRPGSARTRLADALGTREIGTGEPVPAPPAGKRKPG